MAEQLRVTFTDDHQVVSVEALIDGEWVAAELEGEPEGGSDSITITGSDDRYCPPRPGKCWRKINNRCYYFPC